MKIRFGHVTNSSSSSYIVAVKHFPITGIENTYPFIGKVVEELKSLLKHADRGPYSTREQFLEYFRDYFRGDFETEEELLEAIESDFGSRYIDALGLLEDKHSIYVVSFDWNEDQAVEGLLKLLKDETWVKVIED